MSIEFCGQGFFTTGFSEASPLSMNRAPVGFAPRYLSLILRPFFADLLALKRKLLRRYSRGGCEITAKLELALSSQLCTPRVWLAPQGRIHARESLSTYGEYSFEDARHS
jgi:hypothetical protein